MRALWLFIVIFIFVQCFAIKQEGGMVNYCNTKYAIECNGITRRNGRGEPYKTNFTITTRYTWGNNVTIKVVTLGAISMEVVKIKLCDVRNIDWLYDYLKTYAHIDGQCPYKPGKYGLFDMEFPPKNLPLRIRNTIFGTFHTKLTSKFYFIVTKTEEIILECTVNFYPD